MNAIENIILKLDERADLEIERIKLSFEEEGKVMSNFDVEYFKLMFTYKAIQAIEQYIIPSDNIINVHVSNSPKGFKITCSLVRDEQKHFLHTDCIRAGGYNIQIGHYRYLIESSLPRIKSIFESTKIKNKIDKLSKTEKIRKEIASYEKRINDYTLTIEENKKLTQQEILNKSELYKKYYFITWSEIVSRGADINFNNSEEEFNLSRVKMVNDIIISFNQNIIYMQNLIKSLNKTIDKLKLSLTKYQ